MVFLKQNLVRVIYTLSTVFGVSLVKAVTYQEHITDIRCIYSTTDGKFATSINFL